MLNAISWAISLPTLLSVSYLCAVLSRLHLPVIAGVAQPLHIIIIPAIKQMMINNANAVTSLSPFILKRAKRITGANTAKPNRANPIIKIVFMAVNIGGNKNQSLIRRLQCSPKHFA